MAKLTSLADLRSLLPDDAQGASEPGTPAAKTGYDGRPQRLTVRLDTRRRRGKTVTLVTGFQSNPDELQSIVSALKKRCGAGGTVQDNAIEIQGDHRSVVVEALVRLGFDARTA